MPLHTAYTPHILPHSSIHLPIVLAYHTPDYLPIIPIFLPSYLPYHILL